MGGQRAIRRQGVRVLSAAAAAAAIIGLAPVPASAADIRHGNTVTIGPGDTVNDDLYAFGGNINIQGTVNGSVIALGGVITVAGTVSRDLLVSGGTTTVTGKVEGSVRVAGGTVTISSPVGGDVVVGAGTLTIESGATVGRDLVVGAGMVTVAGPVTRKVLAGGGTVTIQNRVGQDVTAQVDQLRLDPGAQINGNLDYTSDNPVQVASGAKVNGTTTRHLPRNNGLPGPGNALLGWLRALVGIFALGLLLMLLFPRFGQTTVDTLQRSPWASLGIGAAVCVVTPIVALIVFVIGLVIGGWWIGLFLTAAYLLALAVGYLVAGLLVGRLVFAQLGWSRFHAVWALLGGLFLLTVVSLIPVIGGLVTLAALLFGLGALSLVVSRQLPKGRVATRGGS